MNDKEQFIFETEYWFVSLAEEQTYLGYCIVVLKRDPCGDLADVTGEELSDFLKLVRVFETALRKAFDATMFNWACLMNNAYQEQDPKPHVHWHIKPRYNHVVELGGEVFEDPNFGHHYIMFDSLNRITSDEMRGKIIAKIQENLPL